MIGDIRLVASLACSKFRNLERELYELETSGIDGLHIDIMDGHFVPNFALGPDIIKGLRPITNLEFEVHLQVEHPENYINLFPPEYVDRLIVHWESTSNLYRLIKEIHKIYKSVFVALNPLTPLSVTEYLLEYVDGICVMCVDPGFAGQEFVPTSVEKIGKLKKITLDLKKENFFIEVDGHINSTVASLVVKAGANMLVLGTSGLYGIEGGFKKAIDILHEAI